MIKYCFNCKSDQVFDDSFDSDCLRCSECGSLPYTKEEWEKNNPIDKEFNLRKHNQLVLFGIDPELKIKGETQ